MVMLTNCWGRLKPIYICNHDLHKSICEYDPNTGRYQEHLRASLPDLNLTRGYYVNVQDVLVGVYASPTGPVLFRNSVQYPMISGQCSCKVMEGKRMNVFIFAEQGETRFMVEYPRVLFIDFDPWSSEEMLELFHWITNRHHEQRFYDFYTLA